MADLTFDPTQGCPIVKNFNCVQEDRAFWDANLAECIFWDEMAGHNAYNEVIQAIGGGLTDVLVDLGKVYKDVTVFVDDVCSLKFHDVAHAPVAMSIALARVGIPVYFKGINARYVLVTTVNPINVTVNGNG